jgi:hypothetical protein
MTTNDLPPKCAACYGPGFLSVAVLGVALAAVAERYLTGAFPTAFKPELVGTLCLGFAGAYLLLLWGRIMADSLSFSTDPIPASLSVAEREAVREQAAKLSGRGGPVARARNLLVAWSLEWNPRPIIVLATFQSTQARAALYGGAIATAVLLFAGGTLGAGARVALSWVGFAVLGVALLARQNQLSRMDGYLESRLLTRLPGNIPQTAMTAADLAAALGASIRSAFKDNVPQPEQAAAAMKEAVESVVKNVANEMAKLEKAGSTVASSLTDGLNANTEKMKALLAAHTQGIDKVIGGILAKLPAALERHADLVGHAGDGWGKQLGKVFDQHAGNIQAANETVAAQLAKIAELEKEVGKVLHIQELVEGAMKDVAVSQEFQKTLASLRQHLESSDRLLAEVSKPRTIRLVETDAEVSES